MLVTRPRELGAGRVFELDALPRIGLELLHAERDALRLRVEADHLDLDVLADVERLGGMVDAPPGDVGHVQQAVDAAEIDEGAVIGDVLDDAVEDLAFLEAGDQLGALLGAALLEDGAARHDDVAARAVHLEDLEGLRRAQQRGDVAHRPDVDLAARQKGHGAVEVDGEAALDPAEDDAGHPLVRLEALFELGPGLLAPRLLARQLGLAVLVLHPLEEDLDGVADMDLGLGAAGGEFLQRHAAFRFEADIDQRGVVLDRDDPALDDGAFEAVGDAERFIEQRGEALLCRRLPASSAPFLSSLPEFRRSAGIERSARPTGIGRGRIDPARGSTGALGARERACVVACITRAPRRHRARRIERRHARRRAPGAVARVAFLHILQDVFVYSRARRCSPQLLDPAAGARLARWR